ncbi:hypothetical protein [Pontibacter akesuensis]|uniref:Uncharacterized protein n=1 Tax=Pontibacter akesuensis TaxID=388950 RepID=A0A1I7IMF1_9BACT|nr:hypothetical protein [Pontibacter akesuensis]GHA67876.1 hypothetical protein GCM10007389_21530 [Pontibacter akesuensis]SFU74121.1 hypothetical protein SAMN04487941_2324 [Pontibacter akesuensis]
MEIGNEPITTQEQYEVIAYRLEHLKDAEPDTPEAEELKRLTRLLVNYIVRGLKKPQKQAYVGSIR